MTILHRLVTPSLLAVLLAAPVLAQPAPPCSGNDRLIVMDPAEVDTFTCRFTGRTLQAIGSQPSNCIDIIDISIPATDADPDAILTTSSTSGADATFSLSPTGRQGNQYEIRIRPLDSDNNRPLCVVRLNVVDASLLP